MHAQAHCGIFIPNSGDSPGSRVTLPSDAKEGGCFHAESDMLRPDISVLLVLFVMILIALGALGVTNKPGFVFGKKADLQTTTSAGVKIDGTAAQTTTPPSGKPDGPAAQSK